MNFFTFLTPITYWILIILWLFILRFYIKRLRSNILKGQLISVLIIILAVDAFRTLFESIYFGAWYTSLAGFLPKSVHTFLVRPEMVFIPKIINVIAAIIVIVLLIYKWLPKEESEKNTLKDRIEKKTKELLRSNENLLKEIKEHKRTATILIAKSNELSDTVVKLENEIRDKKKTEHEISTQKRLFETMFNTIPDGVVLTNTQREIQLANRGMESTFGYKPEELFGKSTGMLYADEDKYQETGTTVFGKDAKKQKGLYVTYYQEKTGRKFPGETFGAKLFDENNQWIGNLGIMRDITDRRQLEEKLRQTQKMESIGNLAGGIAHDFNNLLYPIIGFSEMLKEDLSPDSPEYESAQEIFNAGKRGGELVKQILAFSRQSDHKLQPVRIQKILIEVLRLMRSSIPSDIEIYQDIQPDCGSVMAEATQLHQISMNLITNAYHAVEKTAGRIFVQLKEIMLDAGEFKDSLLKSGQYAMLSVSDNGAGIPLSVINNIFEPYFTTKEKGKGTGLGLAVVYGIVKEYNGDIKVYSEEGIGTTFNVYIPLMKKSAKIVANDPVSVLPTGTENVLLVDDEKSIVRLEKQILERLGYNVVTQTSSIKAFEIFKSNPADYDLVITDMTMPGMTGDKLAEEILSIKSNMPVIICTGFSERINKEQAQAIGVNGFLMKPVVKFEMAHMVRNVLDETII